MGASAPVTIEIGDGESFSANTEAVERSAELNDGEWSCECNVGNSGCKPNGD
jgi:hypothetical protein